MAIYQRNKTWWYRITLHGKKYRGSCRTEIEKEAKEFHDRMKSDLWRVGALGEKPRRTWAELSSRWLSEHSYKRSKSDDVRHSDFWTAQFSRRNVRFIDQITPDVVKTIRDSLLAMKKQRGGKVVKPATINRKLAFLRSTIISAYREYQWIDGVPPIFKLLEENNQRARFLNNDELHRLIGALPEPFASMAKLSVLTGLRQRNIFGLRWDQIDLSRHVIILPDELMKNGLPLAVPLGEAGIQIIREWVGRSRDWVFVSACGTPVKQLSSKLWRKAIAQAGLEDFRWHDLRHTWASMLRQRNVSLDRIKDLGGWRESKMVQRYAHLSTEHLAEYPKLLDELFAPQVRAQIVHIRG